MTTPQDVERVLERAADAIELGFKWADEDEWKGYLKQLAGDARALLTALKAEPSVLQDDLRELLQLLGLPDGARAQSPHEVFQECLAILRQRLKAEPVGWRTMGSAPKDGTWVLVPGGVAHWHDGCWKTLTGEAYPGRAIEWPVTCWQPIPAAPAKPQEEIEPAGETCPDAIERGARLMAERLYSGGAKVWNTLHREQQDIWRNAFRDALSAAPPAHDLYKTGDPEEAYERCARIAETCELPVPGSVRRTIAAAIRAAKPERE